MSTSSQHENIEGDNTLSRKTISKALLIGISYKSIKGLPKALQLDRPHGDVDAMKELLKALNYTEFRILRDHDFCKPENWPDRDNIIKAMEWLVEDATPQHRLFFYYAGHGHQVKDTSGDEVDGWDEAIVPANHQMTATPVKKSVRGRNGAQRLFRDYEFDGPLIVDDEMHDIMCVPLPSVCRLRAVFDMCHSGTALDLHHEFTPDLVRKLSPSSAAQEGQPVMTRQETEPLLSVHETMPVLSTSESEPLLIVHESEPVPILQPIPRRASDQHNQFLNAPTIDDTRHEGHRRPSIFRLPGSPILAIPEEQAVRSPFRFLKMLWGFRPFTPSRQSMRSLAALDEEDTIERSEGEARSYSPWPDLEGDVISLGSCADDGASDDNYSLATILLRAQKDHGASATYRNLLYYLEERLEERSQSDTDKPQIPTVSNLEASLPFT